jgi:hypothetical protein
LNAIVDWTADRSHFQLGDLVEVLWKEKGYAVADNGLYINDGVCLGIVTKVTLLSKEEATLTMDRLEVLTDTGHLIHTFRQFVRKVQEAEA